MTDGLNIRFRDIIISCQRMKEKYGIEYEEKAYNKIAKYSKEIIDKGLINKCSDSHFAKQLCINNCLTYE